MTILILILDVTLWNPYLYVFAQFILQIFIETQVCNAHLSYVTSKRWQD